MTCKRIAASQDSAVILCVHEGDEVDVSAVN